MSDFGFIPSTLAEDGDPTDVLVLMDGPAFPGCLLKCRTIGVIEGEQGKKNKAERNDRIVAIEQMNHSYAHVKHVDDLGKKFVRELEEFFVHYHELTGKEYRILDVKGPKEARRRIKDGMQGPNGGAFILTSVIDERNEGDSSKLTIEHRGGTNFVRSMYLADLGVELTYRAPKTPKQDVVLAQGPASIEQILIAKK